MAQNQIAAKSRRGRLLYATIEAVVLNGLSGLLAQACVAYNARTLGAVDWRQILQSMLFTALVAAPNYLFQEWLEHTFPARVPSPSKGDRGKTHRPGGEQWVERLSIRNTLAKFVLDQSLSATMNTFLFMTLLGMIKGRSAAYIQKDLLQNFVPLLLAGYRFWPMVCLLNLVVMPLEYRPLVGNLAGLGWGVFVSFW